MKIDRSIYHADDKDIGDLLASAKKRFPEAKLVEVARERGILLSELTDREQLVDYISRLGFSWSQLTSLMSKLDSAFRAPKTMTTHLDTSASFAQVTTSAQSTAAERARHRERIVPSVGNQIITLAIKYTEFDESWTRLRQQIDRDMEIRIESKPGTLTIRHPATDRAEDIVDEFRVQLEACVKSRVQRRILSLAGLSVDRRTRFFLDLFNIPGFKVENVTRIRVARPAEDQIKSSDDDEDDVELTEDEKKVEGLVRQVTLEGKQLITTREYQELISRGVCINQAVWRVDQLPLRQTRYELMAGFANGINATRFHYAVRQVWDWNKNRDELNKTARTPHETERVTMAQLIEESAQRSAKLALKPLTTPKRGGK